MRPLSEAYSWRTDDGVPDFPDTGSLTVMDATCGLCARGAKWIARHDDAGAFRIIPVQSELGAGLLRHFAMRPEDPTSWLYLESGYGYSALDATIMVGRKLGGAWRAFDALRLIPKAQRDAVYRIVARNRYKVMGRADLCAMPDPDVQIRLLR